MLKVRTEYYYRYGGTQTIPPCYGREGFGRGHTNHWRVMKDPIRVSRRQIDELNRLLKNRIAPRDDPIRPCQPDTAGAPVQGKPDYIDVARPLQHFSELHHEVFCECYNWRSKWPEDQRWCKQQKLVRFYDRPYNWDQNGF
jgi:Eukaryotic-type carbonic anhydrase